MEDELNYLSEKIEHIDHLIDIAEMGVKLGTNNKINVIILKKEKEYLSNILSKLTELHLND